MKLFSELYKMVEDNEGGSISCARVVTWSCAIVGIVLLSLYFFGIGTNPEAAYTMIGLGIGAGTLKSVMPDNSTTVNNDTINIQVEEKEITEE